MIVTLTNVRGKGPRGVHKASGGVKLIGRGETATVDVADSERAGLEAYFDVTEGPGEDGAVPAQDIASAIVLLDPANDEHWTAAGLPAVEAVADVLGRPVTRAAITEAAPDAKRPQE